MQWGSCTHAGFTTGKPLLSIPESASRRNVAVEDRDPSTVLNFYRRLISLRRQSPALLDGTYTNIGDDPKVFAYRRRAPTQTMIVALNMSGEARTLPLSEVSPADASSLVVRLSSRPGERGQLTAEGLRLAPFEAVILEARVR